MKNNKEETFSIEIDSKYFPKGFVDNKDLIEFYKKSENKLNEIIVIMTSFGVACRINNVIYVNEKLRNYPKLMKAILTHEFNHTNGFSWKDIRLDIRNSELRGLKLQYYKFILRNPSSWIEFLPVWKYEGKIVYNLSLLLIYGFFLIIFGGVLLLL